MFEKPASWLKARNDWLRLLLCFIGGALGAIALPPLSWPAFFFPGFILTVFYLRESRDFRQSFLTGFSYALGYHVAGLYWISASLFIDIARYIWVMPFSALALPAWLGLLFGIACIAAHKLRKQPIAHAVFLSCMIFFSEMARGVLLTGFPWNLFGDIWADTLPLAQSVSLFGTAGLTLLTLLAGTLSSLLLLRPSRVSMALIALSWATLSGLSLWGMQRLDANPTQLDQKITLRIVQPAVKQEERRSFEDRLAALSRLADLSSVKSPVPPTHLLWAETAVPDFLPSEPDLRTAIARLVPKNGALITGTPKRTSQNGETVYANALAILDKRGNIQGLYEKHHLVPFGEFIPFRGILKVMPLATDVIGARADFTPGPGPRTLRTAGFPSFSPLICYEAIFSGAVIDPNDPPDALLQITNDAWFGNTSGPYQHFSQARLRAIEEGLPLLRAANSGISASVDPLGRVISSLPLGKMGVLDVHPAQRLIKNTVFVQFRNWPVFVLAIFLSLLCAIYFFPVSRKI